MRYTVFCGSSAGFDENFKTEAYNLGKALADKTIGLVYGGANVGLMGAVADGCLDHGGEAIGVLPYFLKNVEIEHKALTELFLVETMHDRKAKLNELSNGAIALPGGYGTLEELFEMITWAQLGLHKKPVAILNIDHFYDPLLQMIDKMVESGFLKQVNKEMLIVSDQIEDLLDRMEKYEAPKEGKWITKKE